MPELPGRLGRTALVVPASGQGSASCFHGRTRYETAQLTRTGASHGCSQGTAQFTIPGEGNWAVRSPRPGESRVAGDVRGWSTRRHGSSCADRGARRPACRVLGSRGRTGREPLAARSRASCRRLRARGAHAAGGPTLRGPTPEGDWPGRLGGHSTESAAPACRRSPLRIDRRRRTALRGWPGDQRPHRRGGGFFGGAALGFASSEDSTTVTVRGRRRRPDRRDGERTPPHARRATGNGSRGSYGAALGGSAPGSSGRSRWRHRPRGRRHRGRAPDDAHRLRRAPQRAPSGGRTGGGGLARIRRVCHIAVNERDGSHFLS
jgi:hypothetical protein